MPLPITPSSSAQPARRAVDSRWRKALRRVGLALLGLLVLVAVVFFLLPVWISNEQGRTYVLQRLNLRLARNAPSSPSSPAPPPARITIDDWSLGWFRSTELRNLRILGPDGSVLLSCPNVRSGITLWNIFWGDFDLHNTTTDDLQLVITRDASGHCPLDSIADGLLAIARNARGALQFNNGTISLVSAGTRQSLHLTQVKAAFTIAAREAPFHVQISGLTDTAAPDGSLLPGEIAITTSLPPLRSIGPKSFIQPLVWSLLADADCSGSNLPTPLLCDFLGLDAAWTDSFGPILQTLQFSNHAITPHETSRPSLLLRGTGPNAEDTLVDAKLLLRAPAPNGFGGNLSLASSPDFHLDVALHVSRPLAALLKRLNPLLGEAAPSAASPGGLVRISLSTLNLPLDPAALNSAEATARITFPPFSFVQAPPPHSLLAPLRAATAQSPLLPDQRIDGSAGMLLARLSAGQFSYQNFVVTLGRSRINFGGTIDLNGDIDLLATIPGPTEGLSSGLSQLVIAGTLDAPTVHRAE